MEVQKFSIGHKLIELIRKTVKIFNKGGNIEFTAKWGEMD